MLLNTKPGDLVVRVGNNVSAYRELAHTKPIIGGRLPHLGRALPNKAFGLRMQFQRKPKGLGSRLPRMVIRSGANPPTTQHDIARCK